MARKYLSFLGVLKYKPCTYVFRQQKFQTPFVQEALTQILCQTWGSQDRILVFTTKAAKEKNWDDSDTCNNFGLERRLKLLRLPCPYRQKDIPEGDTEKALWKIFDKVLKQLQEKDEIIFDITSGFRSLPMIALIILNYAKFVKQCKISGIYYGAFEARKAPEGKPEALEEEYEAPVFDLTPFVELFDWTAAIDRFLGTGDASALSNVIVRQAIPRIRRESKGKDEGHVQNLYRISDATRDFSQNSATCRERILPQTALAVQKHIEQAIHSSESLAKPLKPLLEKMEQRFRSFLSDPQQHTANMFQIVHWCQDHQFVQQGLTLLQETVLTDLCHKIDADEANYGDRWAISRTLKRITKKDFPHIKVEEIESEQDGEDEAYPLLGDIRCCLPSPPDQFLKAFEKLRKARNNINHASSLKNAKYFRNVLRISLEILEKEVIENMPG